MTPAQVAMVLAKAAAFDRRTIGSADISAWHEVLSTVDFDDALAAVTRHYAITTVWLMPAHIVRLVAEIRRKRIERAAEVARAYAIEAERANIDARPLRDRRPEIRDFVNQVRSVLPPGDPDTLRYGHKHWRQIRERAERARNYGPNPHYDPEALARLRAAEAAQTGREEAT